MLSRVPREVFCGEARIGGFFVHMMPCAGQLLARNGAGRAAGSFDWSGARDAR